MWGLLAAHFGFNVTRSDCHDSMMGLACQRDFTVAKVCLLHFLYLHHHLLVLIPVVAARYSLDVARSRVENLI